MPIRSKKKLNPDVAEKKNEFRRKQRKDGVLDDKDKPIEIRSQ